MMIPKKVRYNILNPRLCVTRGEAARCWEGDRFESVQHRVLTKEVKMLLLLCKVGKINRVGKMPWTKTGTTYYHTHLTVRISQTKVVQPKGWPRIRALICFKDT